MKNDVPLLYPGVFAKSLAATFSVAVMGCAVAFRIYGELALRDIIGTTISGLIFAYLIHLWIGLRGTINVPPDDLPAELDRRVRLKT